MNKSAGKMALSALAALAGLALFVFVALSGDDISRSVNGLCSGLGGALIGLGIVGILPPATSAMLHNLSTLGVSLHSMSALPVAGQATKVLKDL